MKTEIDWKAKLTSRKLWMAAAEFIGMLLVALNVAESAAAQVVALIMAGGAVIAYILAEGWVDANAGAQHVFEADAEEELFDGED
ncbi:MAG: hypothetical protein Q4A66_02330 [Eubacteriales bacterium]|nr:hypothetical protein [Eubacteriales bacterium]